MTRIEGTGYQVSRRGFIGSAAGLSFVIAFGAKGLALMSEAQAKAAGREFGVWVRIAPDDTITILTPDALRLRHEPAADCARYDSLRRAI